MFIKIELQCQMSELERILMIILKILIDIRDLVSIRLVSCTRLISFKGFENWVIPNGSLCGRVHFNCYGNIFKAFPSVITFHVGLR